MIYLRKTALSNALVAFSVMMGGSLVSGAVQAQSFNQADINSAFKLAEQKAREMIQLTNKLSSASKTSGLVSPRTAESGSLKLVKARDWTSGFFPGELWYLYQNNATQFWKENAKDFTAKIEGEQYNGTTHDMGFKVYCSVGNGYLNTKDPHYKAVLIQAAKTLSTRFNKTAGVIRSWDHNKDKWDYPVIIDNMLNLELLFEATKLLGDSSFYHIAVSHADRTMENHFRADYSSYHVVDYDSTTGKINKKTTHQGYSDSSAWARGQAWALYGYTMCYRETGLVRYLRQAEMVARYIFTHPNLPKDLVPYWDFNDPAIPNAPKDASAAAVIASGLIELSQYSGQGDHYLELAEKILSSLSKDYVAPKSDKTGFLLLHSTGSKPTNSEVDAPLIYADYYYVEALSRLKELKMKKK